MENPINKKQEKHIMLPLSQEQIELLKKQAIETFVKAANAIFIVAVIISQTGIAKSSLINVVFNINLKTNVVKPCTMTVEKFVVKGNKDKLWFDDLPGIGEDKKILNKKFYNCPNTNLKKECYEKCLLIGYA
ncbi:hypothetical protein [Okeania sp. KiyG1]|uniref:hypothetical protein n=1 Tax=Okeania sp. KiyG1 TaxID=2720165 RepID=UPI001924CFD8|nr:hypothetical protein [Okeania sp. KiyG1]GFZ98565.1 hypothetical protein CYANOKiyG1_09920 [Okeania sp. KiyG1]